MRLIIDGRPLTEPLQGGVGRVSVELVVALAETQPETEIVCATTGSRTPTLPPCLTSKPNVKQVHLKIPNKVWSCLSMFRAVSLFDRVERRCGSADVFFMPNLGFVGYLPRHAPSVLLLHDLSFLIEPAWFGRKQQLWHAAVRAENLIKNATRLLAVSENTKRDAIRLLGVPEDKISVIPIGSTFGSSLSRTPVKPKGGESQKRYCLALGLGDPRKNTATAVEAVRLLRKEKGFEDLEVILVGATRRVAPAWVRAVSHPTDSELSTLYANAAAFLYPSWYEGYGLPLHEAAAFGTPCIASTAGSLPETAPPVTLFANPAKPHHWAEALRIALGRTPSVSTPDPQAWQQAATALNLALHADR